MPLTVAELNAKFTADTSGLKTGMSQAKNSLESVAGSFKTIGSAMTKNVTLPIIAIGGLAIKLGMEVQKSEKMFEASMGNMAKSARVWSEQVADSIGQSSNDVREQTAKLFTLTTNMGIARDKALVMSEGIVKLSGDLASFYHIADQDAFEKLKAGIAGRTRGLLELGIVIKEQEIKDKAYAMGLATITEEHGKVKVAFSNSALAAARYQLILDKTAKAHGDFAKNANDPANMLTSLRAKAKDLGETLGVALLPMMVQLLKQAIEITKKIQNWVDWFSKLPPTTQANIVKFALFLATIGPLASTIGSIITMMKALSAVMAFSCGPIGLVVIAIAALVAGLYILIDKHGDTWAKIGKKWSDDIDQWKKSIGEENNKNGVVGSLLSATIKGCLEISNQLNRGTAMWLFKLMVGFRNINTAIANAVVNWVKAMFNAGANMIQGLVNGVKSKVSHAVSTITGFGQTIINGMKQKLGIHSPSTIFYEIGENVVIGLANGIKAKQTTVTEAARKMIHAMTNDSEVASSTMQKVGKSYLEHLARGIKSGSMTVLSAMKELRAHILKINGEAIKAGMEENWASALENMLGGTNKTLEAGNLITSYIEQAAERATKLADLETKFGKPLLNELSAAIDKADWKKVSNIIANRLPAATENGLIVSIATAKKSVAGAIQQLQDIIDKNWADAFSKMLGGDNKVLEAGKLLATYIEITAERATQLADLETKFGKALLNELVAAIDKADWNKVSEIIASRIPAATKKGLIDAREKLAKVLDNPISFNSDKARQIAGDKDATATDIFKQVMGQDYSTSTARLIKQIIDGIKNGTTAVSDAFSQLWQNVQMEQQTSSEVQEIIRIIGEDWWKTFCKQFKITGVEQLGKLSIEGWEVLRKKMVEEAGKTGKESGEAFQRQMSVAFDLIQSGGKIDGIGGLLSTIGKLFKGRTGEIISAVGGGLSSGGGLGAILGGVGMLFGPIGGIVGSLLGGLFGKGGGRRGPTQAELDQQAKMKEAGHDIVCSVINGMLEQFPELTKVTGKMWEITGLGGGVLSGFANAFNLNGFMSASTKIADTFNIIRSSVYTVLGINMAEEDAAIARNRTASEAIIASIIKGMQAKFPQLKDLAAKIREQVEGIMRTGWRNGADLTTRLSDPTLATKMVDELIAAVPGLARNRAYLEEAFKKQLALMVKQFGGVEVDPAAMPIIGQAIIQGIIDGMKGAEPKLQYVMDLLSAAITTAIKDKLAISSPSKVFFGFGQNIIAGLESGIRKGIPIIRGVVGNLGDALSLRGGVTAKFNQQQSLIFQAQQKQQAQIIIELDGQTIARKTIPLIPGILRGKGVVV